MSRKALVAAVILGTASAAGGFAAYHHWQAAKEAERAATAISDAMQFQGLDGKPHKLSEWRGKLLLVNFWASWCVPCLNEIPLLVEAQKNHGAQGFQVVGLAMDTPDQVRQMQQRLHINYPMLLGQADVMGAMDAFGDTLGAFPFSVLVAPDGRVIEQQAGGLHPEELGTWIDHHIKMVSSSS